MNRKKLSLNKERIAHLTNEQSASINGGKASAGSSVHKFTCCWCTGGEPRDTSTSVCAVCNDIN